MRQKTKTMEDITAKFRERDLLIPQYAANEAMRKTRYHDMLRPNIQEFISFSNCSKLDNMISRAQEQEIDLEHICKRKAEHGQTTRILAKKPNGFDSRSRG